MIDILIPSVGRPDSLVPLLENIRQVTPPNSYLVWFVLDLEDRASHEKLIINGTGIPPAPDFTVVLNDGTYPTKIDAAYRSSMRKSATRAASDSAQYVLPTADDVRFHPGWLEAALNALEDPSVQVLGTDDLSPATANRDHATMPILRRSYIELPGAAWAENRTIFHRGYTHNFCETETWQLALHRGVTGWAEDCVIEHLHPAWQKREVDDTDRKGNMRGWEQDQALFEDRRREWSRS